MERPFLVNPVFPPQIEIKEQECDRYEQTIGDPGKPPRIETGKGLLVVYEHPAGENEKPHENEKSRAAIPDAFYSGIPVPGEGNEIGQEKPRMAQPMKVSKLPERQPRLFRIRCFIKNKS